MAVDLTTVPNYSDAQILSVLRMALVNSALAQGYSINGRSLNRMSGTEIQNLINLYEWRITRAASGMFSVARFRPPE